MDNAIFNGNTICVEDSTQVLWRYGEMHFDFNCNLMISMRFVRSTQGVFFSQDTGHITNYHLGPGSAETNEFDSSMPPEHYEALKRAQIDTTTMHTIRVNNINLDQFNDEAVSFYFGTFGKIGDISRPIDLKTRKYRNFMFIRYVRIQGCPMCVCVT